MYSTVANKYMLEQVDFVETDNLKWKRKEDQRAISHAPCVNEYKQKLASLVAREDTTYPQYTASTVHGRLCIV